jgi:uncharacterized damage-inducible protein DinB
MAKKVRAFDLKQALIEAYAVNERMNQYLLENVDDRAWRAAPPGGKGRTIAEIFAHIHNVRHMWLAQVAPARTSRKASRAAPNVAHIS